MRDITLDLWRKFSVFVFKYTDRGIAGERFSDTVARIGFEEACRMLEGDDLLTRKAEIVGK